MRKSLLHVLMDRDGMTEWEALDAIRECEADALERLANGEHPDDICEEYFGLEPDYLEDLDIW